MDYFNKLDETIEFSAFRVSSVEAFDCDDGDGCDCPVYDCYDCPC